MLLQAVADAGEPVIAPMGLIGAGSALTELGVADEAPASTLCCVGSNGLLPRQAVSNRGSAKCLIEVSPEVLDILDAHTQPQ